MSALAALMMNRGHLVSGCDSQPPNPDYDLLHQLAESLPIDITLGNNIAHVGPESTDALVVASYVEDTHREVVAARKRGIPVLRREQLLGLLLRNARTLAVAGVTGKSTTTAMAAHIARRLHLEPFVLVGAYDPNMSGVNYSIGDGRSAIVEACEYRQAFLNVPREVAVITNLYWGEHIECYGTREEMQDAFISFASQAEVLITRGRGDADTDLLIARLSKQLPTIRVGYGPEDDVVIRRSKIDEYSQEVIVCRNHSDEIRMKLSVGGRHNVTNAVMAAVGVSLWSGEYDLAQTSSLLDDFRSLGRRLERVNVGRPVVIDDYAHHPEQLLAGLRALREQYSESKIGIYLQLIGFRRTNTLRSAFLDALSLFDAVFLDEIVPGTADSREDVLAVSSAMLVTELVDRGVEAKVVDSSMLLDEWNRLIGDLDVVTVCGARRTGGLARRLIAVMGTEGQ